MTSRSRRLPALAVLTALGLLAVGPSPLASGQAGLQGVQATADRLRAAIAAENARLSSTRNGLADAQQRANALDARARAREARLADAQRRLIAARIHLSALQRREAAAQRTLAANLLARYKEGRPQLVTVVLSSTHFADLYRQLDFFKRLSAQDARILDTTRTARAEVTTETHDLQGLWKRYSRLAEAAIEDRGRADALRDALLVRERTQLGRRSAAASRLAGVRARIATLERRQAAAARAAIATSGGPATEAPVGDAGSVVGRVIAAANQIASTPYVWGGGHGGASGGYDCSGSVSYALAAGGLLSSPLDSTGFMSWGEAGPGAHITVYANAGHAFMIVDGRRFDTSALSGGGTRWTSQMRSTAGFVARHPPGL